MIALLAGYTYSGTLPGIAEDIELVFKWCQGRSLPTFVSSDTKSISAKYSSKFDLSTVFLDNKADIKGKKVFFFFTGHGKAGHFRLDNKEISMDFIISGLADIAEEVLVILDCCEVSLNVIPSNCIVISASNTDSKSQTALSGSLFVSDCMNLMKSRDCRDLDYLSNKLKVKHPDSHILSGDKLLHGWAVPGACFDYDHVTGKLTFTKGGVTYNLE